LGDTQALRKARGAFFTPPVLSRFIVDWAVRTPRDRVLEPSCGDAGFLVAAAERLRLLGNVGAGRVDGLHGVELHAASAAAAAERLHAIGATAEIEVGDFFDVAASAGFDAVVGNPPYVRYQSFTGSARRKGLEAALAAGVRLTGLASTWAAFTVHASRFLTVDGRLGLVLPAELLTVNYAAPVRDFLLRRFARVRLIAFHERVFPGVLEEVVLLLAEGSGGAAGFEVVHVRDVAALEASGPLVEQERSPAWSPTKRSGKWSPALVDTGLLVDHDALADDGSFLPLAHWGEVYLGSVTGANDYFALTQADVAALGIASAELLPISPPGSRHLRGISFNRADWDAAVAAGGRGFLFRPGADDPSPEALRYIAAGEQREIHTAYKCRVRRPWWRVPLVRAPDLFLTYMNHRYPRLVSNEAGVHHLNSVHGVRLRAGIEGVGRELLPLAHLNSLSLLSAEVVGRAYGGGMLKLEPREAVRWLAPSPELVNAATAPLRALRAALEGAPDRAMEDVISAVDDILLSDALGLAGSGLSRIREARRQMISRRTARSGKARAAH